MQIELRDYQERAKQEARRLIHEGKKAVLIVAPTGSGKCLGRGTPVLLSNGKSIPVEDVAVGDRLLGPDGNPRNVLGVSSGREMLYRVTPKKGDPYIVNASHILSLRDELSGRIVNIGVLDYLGKSVSWRSIHHGWRVPGVLCDDLVYVLTQISVEPIGVGEYFGFEIDGDRLFLLGDFTVTHNTVISASLMENAVKKGNSVNFVVDRLSLIDQTSDVMEKYGIAHGVIQASHARWQPWQKAQVCSIQTLSKRDWPESKLDIFDEAHVLHQEHKDRLASTDGIVVGLTATPFTKGLGKYFDGFVNVTTTRQLIQDGWLVPYRIFSCAEPDMSDVPVSNTGEWVTSKASSKALEVVGDVVAEYIKHGQGRKFICSAVDTAHVLELQRQFLAAGINAATYTYRDKQEDRAEVVNEFRLSNSSIRGLITVTAASRGFDVPDVSCLDAKTEVLTPQGWRGMWDAFREVVAFDTGTGALSTEQVEARVMKPRVGEMVCIKGGQFDVRVTDDHRMVAGTTGALTKWRVMSAGEVASLPRFRLPASGNALPTSGVDLTDDELRFVAWFITDGGWVRSRAQNRVQIAQSKPDMVIRIRELLERLGYKYGEYVYPNQRGYAARHAMPLHRFHIPIGVRGDARGHGFHAIAEYLDKGLSPKLLSMDDRQFRVFWEELLHGDGNGDTRRKPQLCIGHQGLLANLQALAVMRGHATNATSAVTCKNGDPFWLMSWDDRKHREVKAKNGTVKTERSTGEPVWCVQNRLGTLVIRRNGRVSIVGNCIIMARPLRKSLAEHIQLFGRGLRISPETSKRDLIVLDHSGNAARFYRECEDFFDHGITELDDGTPKPKEKPQEKPEKEPMKCPSCGHLHDPRPFCPACGHQYPKKEAITHVPGSLKELVAGGHHDELNRGLWPMIVGYTLSRNGDDLVRAKSRALGLYKSITGKFPDRNFDISIAAEPSPEILRKIKSVQIAYAYSKKKAA